jgi:LPS-assembly lipoprotein
MSLLSRRALILMPLAILACGFTPVFAPNGGDMMGKVAAKAPTTRNDFELVKQLELRLGRPDAAAYALDYTIRTETVSLGFTTSGDITRYNLLGTLDWTLTDPTNGTVLDKGQAKSFTAWSATGSTAAAQTVEADASRRLMRVLADQLVTQLTVFGASRGK